VGELVEGLWLTSVQSPFLGSVFRTIPATYPQEDRSPTRCALVRTTWSIHLAGQPQYLGAISILRGLNHSGGGTPIDRSSSLAHHDGGQRGAGESKILNKRTTCTGAPVTGQVRLDAGWERRRRDYLCDRFGRTLRVGYGRAARPTGRAGFTRSTGCAGRRTGEASACRRGEHARFFFVLSARAEAGVPQPARGGGQWHNHRTSCATAPARKMAS
jgi:hypothetical protein